MYALPLMLMPGSSWFDGLSVVMQGGTAVGVTRAMLPRRREEGNRVRMCSLDTRRAPPEYRRARVIGDGRTPISLLPDGRWRQHRVLVDRPGRSLRRRRPPPDPLRDGVADCAAPRVV